MDRFFLGLIGGIISAVVVWFSKTFALPYLQDRIFYKGVRIDGYWDIYDVRADGETLSGKLTLVQRGSRVTGTSHRTVTRDGAPSDRQFNYVGRVSGEQLTLRFEDARGLDFDSGTYVFRIHNNLIEMHGMATFHGKRENRIISEARVLRRIAQPVPA